MVKNKLLYLTFTLFIIVFFLIFILIQNDQPQNRLDTVNASISPKILALYQNNCASCHGGNLQGQIGWQNTLDEDGHRLAPPLNGSAHTWHHSPEYLFNVIKYGFPFFDSNYQGKMLGNSNLSSEEAWQLVSYIRQVWPEEIQDVYGKTFGQ